MLEIYFGTRKDTVSNPPIFFNYNVNPRLLLGDKEIQQMILDIDKTVLTDNGQLISPVLPIMGWKDISGGVKTLILIKLYGDKINFNITACGENCSKWIEVLAERQDISVNLKYPMKFSENIHAIIKNTNREIWSYKDFIIEYLRERDKNDNWLPKD